MLKNPESDLFYGESEFNIISSSLQYYKERLTTEARKERESGHGYTFAVINNDLRKELSLVVGIIDKLHTNHSMEDCNILIINNQRTILDAVRSYLGELQRQKDMVIDSLGVEPNLSMFNNQISTTEKIVKNIESERKRI
jgi:hypothetical protein